MSWLTAENLEHAVERCAENATVRHAFLGVYPHNRLPPPLLPPSSSSSAAASAAALATAELPPPPLTLIVNTDSHNLPGRHWTSIYIDRNRHGELFDSLVVPPSGYLIRFMNRHCRQWVRNRLMYQHPASSYCGVYVLLHVLNRHKYSTLKHFCEATFTPSLFSNECLVTAYYKRKILRI